MKWMYPSVLFGLLALLIPLIIHLFHFKRYKTIFFSSLAFLKSIEKENQSVRKLKQWIIWSLRTFAFLFLVFAFAQPYIPSSGKNQKSGISIIGVYIDNSFSMSQLGKQGELLSQAKEMGRSLIDDTPRNTKFLLLTNDLSGAEKQLLNKEQFLDRIDKINFAPYSRGANAIIQFWNQWNTDNDKNGFAKVANQRLIFLSDFQESTFGKLKKTSNFQGILNPIQFTPATQGNLFVDTVWFESPNQKLGNKQIVYARIKNEYNTEQKEIDVNFKLGTINKSLYSNIPANGSDTVSITYFNQTDKRKSCMITVSDKQMNQDDAYYFSYDVQSNSNVLIINGEDAVPNIKTVYDLDDFYKVKSISESQISVGELNAQDFVVINGMNNFSSFAIKNLVDFCSKGGGILLFPGKNCTLSSWNALLSQLQMPQLSSITTTGLNLDKVNTSDPFFKGVFEKTPSNLNLPSIKKTYRMIKNKDALFASVLSYQNGNDFFAISRSRNTVFLCTSSLAEEFSSFISNQLFPTLLLRCAELSNKQRQVSLVIGQQSSFPVPSEIEGDLPISLVNKKGSFVPQIYTLEDQKLFSLKGLDAVKAVSAGNYDIIQGKENSGNKKSFGLISLNVERTESLIKALSKEKLQRSFAEAGYQFKEVSDAQNWSNADFLQLEQAKTYWKLCLILVLIFLLAEMVVSAFFKGNV